MRGESNKKSLSIWMKLCNNKINQQKPTLKSIREQLKPIARISPLATIYLMHVNTFAKCIDLKLSFVPCLHQKHIVGPIQGNTNPCFLAMVHSFDSEYTLFPFKNHIFCSS